MLSQKSWNMVILFLTICINHIQLSEGDIGSCIDWNTNIWYALDIRFYGVSNFSQYVLYSFIEVDRWWGFKHYGTPLNSNGDVYRGYSNRWYKNDVYMSRIAIWLVHKENISSVTSSSDPLATFEPSQQRIADSVYFKIFNYDIITYGDFSFSKKWYCPTCTFDPNRNYWRGDDEVIYVDNQGLHLQIIYDSTYNRYYSSEVKANQALGYGSYFWTTNSRIDALDVDTVLGLFIYDYMADSTNYDHSEIDFQIAKWGNISDSTNAQVVVQPYYDSGNLIRFNVPDLGTNDFLHYCTFGFYYSAEYVHFVAYIGEFEDIFESGDSILIFQHNYTKNAIEPSNQAVMRMNLWTSSVNKTVSENQHVLITDVRFCDGHWAHNLTECSEKSEWKAGVQDDQKCPTLQPTSDPSQNPTQVTQHPTMNPTSNPSNNPTQVTQHPTMIPTSNLSKNPTQVTQHPTVNPTPDPSKNSTKVTQHPTVNPTPDPSKNPTQVTQHPTMNPTSDPSKNSTKVTQHPTMNPPQNSSDTKEQKKNGTVIIIIVVLLYVFGSIS